MSSPHDTPLTPARQNAIPTNDITYRGRRIPARIDVEARLGYIIEVMAQSFQASEHHITLCLRDENDHLVTQSNLALKVKSREVLKLVLSPASEAVAAVTSLKYAEQNKSHSNDSAIALGNNVNVIPLKLALFNLSKYVKEDDFAVEFMIRGGTKVLVALLERGDRGLTGNTLAYALQGVRGILEFESSWSDLTDLFVDQILHIVVYNSQPNILRPATAIIRKLVISTSQVDTGVRDRKGKGKAGAKPKNEATFDNPFGFDRIFKRMKHNDIEGSSNGAAGLFKVVTKRLEGTGDLELVAQSLGLINACLRSAQQSNSAQYDELVNLVTSLMVGRHVSRLIPTSSNNIVEPQILNFQARYAAILHHRRLKQVRPGQSYDEERMLADIWRAGRLGQPVEPGEVTNDRASRWGSSNGHTAVYDSERNWQGWKRIGLETENDGDHEGPMPFLEVELFRDVGDLGLDCLHWFVVNEDQFYNIILEQEAKPIESRCPIGKASAECVKILCDHYKITLAGHHSPPSFQLFLLNFPRLHALVLKFLLRMWTDSDSRVSDFDRLSFLVRSQVHLSLSDEASKSWLNLEKDFLELDYRTVRDRQMEMLEQEDGMLNRPSVRELREKLGREAYEVLADQRAGCMLQGAWFNSSTVLLPGVVSSVRPNATRPLRFVRLSPNKRMLAWGEFAKRQATPPEYESLRERIDLGNVTDIRMQTGCAIGSRSPNMISKLSFSLMSGSELSLLDVDAVHTAQLAEWTDGLRVLRGEAGMATKETASYVHILTELALKVRLLDITGDGVELPDKVTHGTAPLSVDFWFAK